MKYIYGTIWGIVNSAIVGGIWYGMDYVGWTHYKIDWSSDLILFGIIVGSLSYMDGLRANQ